MPSEELIPALEFCDIYHVELSFIQTLHESGLIETTIRDGAIFLPAKELLALERFARWHYELAINSEGIEALFHLLGRLEHLMEENRQLRNRLQRYEGWDGAAQGGTVVESPPET